MTQGGPANATEILMYKVYNDGFVGWIWEDLLPSQ